MAVLKWNDSSFKQGVKRLLASLPDANRKALYEIGSEILRLSSFEVPHDKGLLQNSGSVQEEPDKAIVGYNKVYAARLHEHPEYKFQKGRKGKYLEDPIKNNLGVFRKYYGDAMRGALR